MCRSDHTTPHVLWKMVAYVRKSSALCVSKNRGTHSRVIIRITLMFLLCEMDTECEIIYNLLIASSIKKKHILVTESAGSCRSYILPQVWNCFRALMPTTGSWHDNVVNELFYGC